MMPERLVVPLFQRPYVWNEENQWEPLWNDVARVFYAAAHVTTATRRPLGVGAHGWRLR